MSVQPGCSGSTRARPGKVENCQIGTFLAYVTAKGRALIDRELYLPKSWIQEPDRCVKAAVPGDVDFATNPEQARLMIERAVAAGGAVRLVHRR